MNGTLYCFNNGECDQGTFHYTQDTYCKETKVKKHYNYLKMREQGIINKKDLEK